MRVRPKEPSIAAKAIPAGAPPPPLDTTKPADAFLDGATRDALMDDAKRVGQQGGPRPLPQMKAQAQVRTFESAVRAQPAPGVETATISKSADDPSVALSRTDVAAGSKTPLQRLDTDERVLVEGSGTLSLNGVEQPIVPGDIVLLPAGTKFGFTADRGVPLKLWTVSSPTAEAKLQQSAGVLSEDPKKEFFVGEGVLILERANSELDPGVGFDRARVPAGMTTALHKLKIDERYLITRGGGVMELDGVKTAVKAGDVVMIPKGTAQRITAGAGGVDFYCVTTPRFLVEDYDQHLADAAVNRDLYDGSAGPLDAVLAKIHPP